MLLSRLDKPVGESEIARTILGIHPDSSGIYLRSLERACSRELIASTAGR
ncbi:MAG TPA: hypothetical protein VE136_17015 [Anaerolineales bacterium]|nr:hypothetical protein [Anaerolineales bacterium]